MPHRIAASALLLAAMLPMLASAALTVVEPDGVNDTIAAGSDFATQTIGDPWDYGNTADVRLDQSVSLTNQTLANGRYTGTSTSVDPYFYPYFGGFPSSVPITVEAQHPIPTASYRYFTAKVRYTAASAQFMVMYFYPTFATFNFAAVGSIPANSWQIVTVDLATAVSGSPSWTGSPQVVQLRLDPMDQSGVTVDVDWIRLTGPGTPQTAYTVTWTDTGSGPYTVTAIDGDNARFVLGTGVNGTSYAADFSRLPPGDYRVEVARTGATSLSPGSVHVNNPPLLSNIVPNERGDQSRDFAATVTGNPWGPMDATDVLNTPNVTNVTYTNPVGSLSGRPTNNDPNINMNLRGHTIDASLYRSLCFQLEIYGPQSVGVGSVTRLFWGTSTLRTSDDIVIETGTHEYCVADMATIPTEPSTPGTWTGNLSKFRLDPHEFPLSAACTNNPSPANCRDFRLDYIVLSPWYRANPTFNFRWNLADADNASGFVSVALDPDLVPGNGNEISVGTVDRATGASALNWTAPPTVAPGTYNVYVSVSDGINTTGRYGNGPLVVQTTGAADTIFRDGFQ